MKYAAAILPALFVVPFSLAARPAGQNQARSNQQAMRDCEFKAPHSAAIGCKAAIAKKSRARVDALYKENLTIAATLDSSYNRLFHDSTDKNQFVHHVTGAQKAWLAYAKSHCEFEERTTFGGSGGWDLRFECENRLNLKRADDLTSALKLAR